MSETIATITCIAAVITGVGIYITVIQNYIYNSRNEVRSLSKIETNFTKTNLGFEIPSGVPWRIIGIKIPGHFCLKKKAGDSMWIESIEYNAPYEKINPLFNSGIFDPKRVRSLIVELTVVSTLNAKERKIRRRFGFYSYDGFTKEDLKSRE